MLAKLAEKKWLFVVPALALLLGFGALAGGASAGRLKDSSGKDIANIQSIAHGPARPATADGYLIFEPEGSAPPNGGTVNVGDRFVLGLWLDTGSNAPPNGATAQQSYLTYTYDLIKNVRVDQIATACVLTSTVTSDYSTFTDPLQNEICNGTGPNGDQPC